MLTLYMNIVQRIRVSLSAQTRKQQHSAWLTETRGVVIKQKHILVTMNLTCLKRHRRFQLYHHLFQKTRTLLSSGATPAAMNENLLNASYLTCFFLFQTPGWYPAFISSLRHDGGLKIEVKNVTLRLMSLNRSEFTNVSFELYDCKCVCGLISSSVKNVLKNIYTAEKCHCFLTNVPVLLDSR